MKTDNCQACGNEVNVKELFLFKLASTDVSICLDCITLTEAYENYQKVAKILNSMKK